MSDKLENIRVQRTEVYGDASEILSATGKAFTALLEAHYGITLPHDIPPHVVAQMNILIKSIRIVRPMKYNQDSYDDLMNYCKIGEEVDERKPQS